MKKVVRTKRPVTDVSDLEKFDEAYTDFSALTDGVDPQTLERDGSGHPNDEVPGSLRKTSSIEQKKAA